MYYRGVDIRDLETRAAADGVEVPSGKPATLYKVYAAERAVGASEGEESRWVRVEDTNGDFHGHPISQRRYEEYMRRRQKLVDAPATGDPRKAPKGGDDAE